jgi:AcrR family transcriptional regulator
MSSDGARREEILETAAAMFASSGLRTSLKEIADACGILPGSLYHHFESKEAIVIELVQRYRDDLDRVAKEAVNKLHEPSSPPVEGRVIELGRAIADCCVRHRAAVLLTLYQPPAVLGAELAQLALQTPSEIETAMVEILREGRASRAIRPGIDLELLADRLCQSMLHVGVGVSHLTPGAEHAPELRLRILLNGIVQNASSNAVLDRSDALRVARENIAAWGDEAGEDDRLRHLRAVAREEFGRRGYESTTIRDIAAAAGLSTGTFMSSIASATSSRFSLRGCGSLRLPRPTSTSRSARSVHSSARSRASLPRDRGMARFSSREHLLTSELAACSKPS